jgi:hypothetical protein
MTDKLEEKAAEALTSVAETLIEIPQQLIDALTVLRELNKNDAKAVEQLDELSRKVLLKIPDIAHVINDYAKALETFLNYKISKRQEEATQRQEAMTRAILKHNKILAYSTTLLAVSTFALVLVTVLLHL